MTQKLITPEQERALQLLREWLLSDYIKDRREFFHLEKCEEALAVAAEVLERK